MDSSVPQRDVGQVKKIWRQIRAQLHDWDVGTMTSGSLYAGESSEASPSVEAGARQKRFAKVCTVDQLYRIIGARFTLQTTQMYVNAWYYIPSANLFALMFVFMFACRE